MAEGVVDALESVEVDEHDRGRMGAVRLLFQGTLKPLVEERAVGKTGEVVVLRMVPDLLLGATKAADVGNATDDEARAVGQAYALLAGDDRADVALPVGEKLFILIDLARIEHKPVGLKKDIGMFFGDEIVIGTTDERIMGAAHELAHALIEHDKAMALVLDEDWMRHGIEDSTQSVHVCDLKWLT